MSVSYVPLAVMPVQLNLDDLCRDVMNMNLRDDEGSFLAFKNEVGNGVGQKSALEN